MASPRHVSFFAKITPLRSWFLLTLQGGWETDETIEQAALREALEEAGVQGNVEVSSQSFHLPPIRTVHLVSC